MRAVATSDRAVRRSSATAAIILTTRRAETSNVIVVVSTMNPSETMRRVSLRTHFSRFRRNPSSSKSAHTSATAAWSRRASATRKSSRYGMMRKPRARSTETGMCITFVKARHASLKPNGSTLKTYQTPKARKPRNRQWLGCTATW